MGFRLTQYGRRELIASSGILAAATGLALWLCWPAAAAPLALWAWVIAFFRDPQRPIPEGQGLFTSPADGTVTDITPVGPDSALGQPGVKIGVFMSVFSVHVNRSPCDGIVRSIEHVDGAFLDARDARATSLNESATIYLSHEHRGEKFPVVFRQIAGRIARRIVTDLAAGVQVRRGQRVGMIKFGSRAELLVPAELAGCVRVKAGQKVKAGSTVLISTEAENGT